MAPSSSEFPDLTVQYLENDLKLKMDVRDRAAYVYVTGHYPTHLRKWHTGVIRAITSYSKLPTSLDGRTGSFKLKQLVVDDLALDEHPMVVMVRRKMFGGWKMQVERATTQRRPYSKVFMWRRAPGGMEKITVQVDGSVKEGWD